MMEMKKLARYLINASKQGQRILVVGHAHADPDAAGCVVAMEEALNQLGGRANSGIPENISRLTKGVLNFIGLKLKIDPPLDADLVIVVDASTLGQLGKLGEEIDKKGTDFVVIDHHRPSEGARQRSKFYWVKEGASSTAEMVLKLVRELGTEMSSKASSLLLTGVITDTGHFRFADGSSFEAVVDLIDMGADYGMSLEALKMPEDQSKRVAMLKAAGRSEVHRAHKRWIAFSEISAFESDVASMLVGIGADVALAGGEDDEGKIRISARSRRGVASETNLHLGELMSELAHIFDGTGGGHRGAAAMMADADLEEVKEKGLSMVKKMLRPKVG